MAAVLETVESLLSFLEQASAVMGDQVYAEAKAQQLGRLRSQILSTRDLGVGMAANVIGRLRQSNLLVPSEVEEIVSMLHRATQVPTVSLPGRQGQTQDFRNFAAFVTADVWQSLHSPSFTSMDVLVALATFLGSIGCIVPSETTCQHLTAAYLLLTKASSFMTMGPSEKHELYDQQKVWIRSKLRSEYTTNAQRHGWPYILSLPMDPATMPEQWQGGRSFGCPQAASWASDVRILAATIPMRQTHGQLKKQTGTAGTVSVATQLIEAMTALLQRSSSQQPLPGTATGMQMAAVATVADHARTSTAEPAAASASACQALVSAPEALPADPSNTVTLEEQPKQSGNKAFEALAKLAPGLSLKAPEQTQGSMHKAASEVDVGHSKSLRKMGKQPQGSGPGSGSTLKRDKKKVQPKTKVKGVSKDEKTKLKGRVKILRQAGVPKAQILFYQDGCPRCRHRAYCTQSCWIKRHFDVSF